ncbi:hypothetical protein [Marinitoga sp. 38H-ov]|uniref:hypothetical protein n=1 Tax=Marinitoga sp. 38H-ov TaxID=1755814 RepID=UPI0013ECA3C5|nr:hypothetical protein [Marinitoga sp. 38H-ov]KAF2956870.1 hypothetical protein AS160_03725 [Marinitoga sp. 38H-ov]
MNNLENNITLSKYNKKLEVITGSIEKIEDINNSKYMKYVYVKDDCNNIYKTMINIRHTGNLNIKNKITIEGVAIKFFDYYKLISYKIYYNKRKFSIRY